MDYEVMSYRSMIDNELVLFTVNMDIQSIFEQKTHTKLVRFVLPYQQGFDGLPLKEEVERTMGQYLQILSAINMPVNGVYAGHTLGKGYLGAYFYTKDSANLLNILAQYPILTEIEVDEDEDWSLYFDYLSPTTLELLWKGALETTLMMVEKGIDLTKEYQLVHRFYFPTEQKENMLKFIKQYQSDNQYHIFQTSDAIYDKEEDEYFYLVTLSGNTLLQGEDVYTLMEQLYNDSHAQKGLYQGWDCDELKEKMER